MIKILVRTADNPHDLARQVEEVQNINNKVVCKGSQIFEYEGSLFAYIYFVKGNVDIVDNEFSPEKRAEFVPNKTVIKMWSNVPATERQVKALEDAGVDIKDGLNKYEAFLMIQAIK